MSQTYLTSRVLRLTFPGDPAEILLVQEIHLACPGCGEIHVQIGGHHLVALRDLLSDTISAYPELCGKGETTEIRVPGGMTPEKVGEN